jgi:hypothetical protein
MTVLLTVSPLRGGTVTEVKTVVITELDATFLPVGD